MRCSKCSRVALGSETSHSSIGSSRLAGIRPVRIGSTGSSGMRIAVSAKSAAYWASRMRLASFVNRWRTASSNVRLTSRIMTAASTSASTAVALRVGSLSSR